MIVLAVHRFVRGSALDFPDVSPAQLDPIFEGLQPENFRRLDSDGFLPPDSAACWTITSDDGLESDTELATYCEQYGARLTLFVSPGLIGQPGYLSRSALMELSERGHVIGSHTFTHRRLANIDPGTLREEVVRAKETLEDWLNHEVPFFAYPGGVHNSQVRREVKRAGHKWGFATTQCKVGVLCPRYCVPRISLNAQSNGDDVPRFKARRTFTWLEHIAREPARRGMQIRARRLGLY